MIKIKIPHLWLILVRAYGLKKEREKIRREKVEEKKKEEEKRRIQVWNISFVWNTCLDICKETIVRMLVWNCLETLELEILV